MTLPASALREVATVPAQVTGLYGNIRAGRATLAGGYTLDWDLRESELWRLRALADVTLEGPDTRLEAQVVGGFASLSARSVSGRAGPGLLALIPEPLISDCTSRAVVDIQEVSISRSAAAASGVIQVDGGQCKDMLGRDMTIPQMTVDLSTQGDDARAVVSDRDGELGQITIAGDRRLILRVEPEGATLIPGMPTSGPVIVEYLF
ncbi:type II secretion system protein N [Sulfitobacter sp. THAF37]|uniref:type II secretion system protein N n=1 Tax=Sulfitobacter sp. THAF37 TaxID=2587855 RepID=UPI0015625B67|nr:type II secretion system protein N [Sulfitobacter sp. THAF37]